MRKKKYIFLVILVLIVLFGGIYLQNLGKETGKIQEIKTQEINQQNTDKKKENIQSNSNSDSIEDTSKKKDVDETESVELNQNIEDTKTETDIQKQEHKNLNQEETQQNENKRNEYNEKSEEKQETQIDSYSELPAIPMEE